MREASKEGQIQGLGPNRELEPDSDSITQLQTPAAMLECGVGVSITSSYTREAGNCDVYVKFSD